MSNILSKPVRILTSDEHTPFMQLTPGQIDDLAMKGVFGLDDLMRQITGYGLEMPLYYRTTYILNMRHVVVTSDTLLLALRNSECHIERIRMRMSQSGSCSKFSEPGNMFFINRSKHGVPYKYVRNRFIVMPGGIIRGFGDCINVLYPRALYRDRDVEIVYSPVVRELCEQFRHDLRSPLVKGIAQTNSVTNFLGEQVDDDEYDALMLYWHNKCVEYYKNEGARHVVVVCPSPPIID